ncbi:MAG TPA: hypothetical protein VHV80_12705 [Steroidobacteraceae bacterium]|nr:hypothetical protein [Steroidobacteraceae bacterium]
MPMPMPMRWEWFLPAVRWGNAKNIQADVEALIRETQEITTVLGERMRREHAQLYALADSLTH